MASKPPASLAKGSRSDCACAPSGRECGLGERLLDANRTIGQPDKLTTIFGHKVTKSYRGKLETEIQNMHLPNPGNPRPIPQRLLQTICARPFHSAPAELWPKVGAGMNWGRRHIVGVFEPPLLHRRSDMPCPTIPLSN